MCLLSLFIPPVLGVMPLPILHPFERIRVLGIVARFLILPFGDPGFVDSFLADITTSLVQALKYFTQGLCYSFMGVYSDPTFDASSVVPYDLQMKSNLALNLVSLWPYLVRLLQCLNRAVITQKVWPHCANAGKYISTIVSLVFAALKDLDISPSLSSLWSTLWTVFVVISSIYSSLWDIFVDWSLFTIEKRNRFFTMSLRTKRFFHPLFYSIAVIVDIVLRFAWATTLMPSVISWFPASPAQKLFLGSLEVVRRFIWAVIRVENEHISKYGMTKQSTPSKPQSKPDLML